MAEMAIDGGTERFVPCGILEINAKVTDGTVVVVIELKAGTAQRESVGQTSRR